jgi:hypothetical protein
MSASLQVRRTVGNDTGWDNSTTFDHDRVIEAPDLAAFLVVQLDVLPELAAELGRDGETDEWRREVGPHPKSIIIELSSFHSLTGLALN